MSHVIRCSVVALPLVALQLGMFNAGCSRSSRTTEYRTESSSNRIVGEPVASDEYTTSESTEARVEVRDEEQTDQRGASAERFDVTLDEIRGHVRDNTAVIIDARSAEDFRRGHVRGAINIPASQKESAFRQAKSNLSTDQLIIIYCGSPQCPAGETVHEYLLSQGYTNMRVFKPGWKTLSLEKDLH